MRYYTLRKGLYKGKHCIYDSRDEAEIHGITDIKTPWWNKDVEAGDWIESDDGYIVQCLHRSKLYNKRHKSGQYTDLFTFPQGVFYVYYDKKGNPNIKNFFASVSKPLKGRLGTSSTLGKYMNPRKRLFITYIKNGVDPVTSYMAAFNKHTSPLHIAVKKVNELLTDPELVEELMIAMKPFISQVESRVRELSNNKYEDLNALYVDKVARLLLKDNKSAMAEVTVLNFSLKLFGHQINLIADEHPSKNKFANATEASFEEVPPKSLN